MHGMETIGSAERATDTYEMREQFHNISDGEYANLLFNHFGQKRVEDELEEYLSHNGWVQMKYQKLFLHQNCSIAMHRSHAM